MSDSTLNLDPRDDGYLALNHRLFGLIPLDLGELGEYGFAQTEIGGVQRLIAKQGDRRYLVGSKVSPTPIPPSWHARLGEYRLQNAAGPLVLLDRVRLEELDGFLLVELEAEGERSRTILRPLDDTHALLLERFAHYGTMVEVQQLAGRETLSWSGLQFVPAGESGDLL